MKKNDLEWSGADAKFIEALLLATGGEGGANLQDVLLMVDALDSSVLSLAEVEQAIQKLSAAGCLLVQKNKLMLTPAFVTEYETAVTAVPDITDTERIQELLNCYALSEAKIKEAREELKKYKLKNYYQQYQEQFG